MTTRARIRYRTASLWGAVLLPLSLVGCGQEQTPAIIDAAALLERIEQDRHRHDPHAYSEVDLGEFTITWRREGQKAGTGEQKPAKPDEAAKPVEAQVAQGASRDPAVLIIRFHLYGVVSDNQVEQCGELLETHGERVRSRVRETVQGSLAEQLQDPTLGWLKSDLIQSINQSLQAPILRDVAFAEFALDRG